jgi:hypothetical protein
VPEDVETFEVRGLGRGSGFEKYDIESVFEEARYDLEANRVVEALKENLLRLLKIYYDNKLLDRKEIAEALSDH